MVTGVRHKEQAGDLEAGEGAHVTVQQLCKRTVMLSSAVASRLHTQLQRRELNTIRFLNQQHEFYGFWNGFWSSLQRHDILTVII